MHNKQHKIYLRFWFCFQVYYVSKAALKTANKQYSNLDNDYEMTFNNETQMIPCTEDVDLPSVTFKFIGIQQLSDTEANSNIGIRRNLTEIRAFKIVQLYSANC